MDRLRYLEDDNYLLDLYLSLLQRAIGMDRINEAHPAFFHIIEQLSPDEALLLFKIAKEKIDYEYTMDLTRRQDGNVSFINEKIMKDTSPKDKITFVEHFEMYISHLESLNLLKWPVLSEEAIWDNEEDQNNKRQNGIYVKTRIQLTKFGDLFVKACISRDKIFILK